MTHVEDAWYMWRLLVFSFSAPLIVKEEADDVEIFFLKKDRHQEMVKIMI